MLLNEMEIFYHVVEQQSFSKAAERLGVSKSFISKRITKLEQDLKVRLISRSTRKLILTEEGKNFYRYCAVVVQEGEKGYSMINELQGKPSGVLKISIPPALALNLILPLFPKYSLQYPEVVLDIQLESRIVDLINEGYDLALRAATLESSNLISQKIYTIENIICASKNYFQKHGIPKNAADLTHHNCAIYSDSKAMGHIKLTKQQYAETIHIKGNFMSNQLELIKQMVLNDVCLAILPEFMVTKELKNSTLIQCLENYKLPPSNLYAIYPEREFMLPKLKSFLEMIKNHLD